MKQNPRKTTTKEEHEENEGYGVSKNLRDSNVEALNALLDEMEHKKQSNSYIIFHLIYIEAFVGGPLRLHPFFSHDYNFIARVTNTTFGEVKGEWNVNIFQEGAGGHHCIK